MSIKDIPLYKSIFHERPAPEKMIAALKFARSRLRHENNAYAGICNQLPSDPVGLYLIDYINDVLGDHMWLNGWRSKRGLLIDRKSMTKARIAWIDWMIALLEEEIALSK